MNLAKSKGWLLFKTSAKNGTGVEELFTGLVLGAFNLPTADLQGQALRELYSKRQMTIPFFDSSRGILSRENSKNEGYDSSKTQSPMSKFGPAKNSTADVNCTNKDTKPECELTGQTHKQSNGSTQVSPLLDSSLAQPGVPAQGNSGGFFSKLAKLCCG